MAKVKTLRAHGNGYGKTYQKKKGAKYDHPSPAALVAAEIVELVEIKKKDAPPPAGS